MFYLFCEKANYRKKIHLMKKFEKRMFNVYQANIRTYKGL